MPSIDHEAEQAIDAQEAEFGADGTRVFRDTETEPAKPTLGELHEQYKPIVIAAVLEDVPYRNACGHSDFASGCTGKSSTRPIHGSMSSCVLSHRMTLMTPFAHGTATFRASTPLSATWKPMRGRKIPPHGWPARLTAATAKPRSQYVRTARRGQPCPGPKSSAGLRSLSRRTASIQKKNRIGSTTLIPLRSVNLWRNEAS